MLPLPLSNRQLGNVLHDCQPSMRLRRLLFLWTNRALIWGGSKSIPTCMYAAPRQSTAIPRTPVSGAFFKKSKVVRFAHLACGKADSFVYLGYIGSFDP